MSCRTLMLAALLGLGVTAALLAGASPAPEKTKAWEYAVYRSLGNRYQWQTPDAAIFAHGLPEFCKQLKLKTPKSRASAEIELTNHFGRQGWELIQMAPTSGTGVFWFKRPVR